MAEQPGIEGALSSLRGEADKKVAGQAWEKASNVRVLGQPLADMAAGAALGFGVRTAARVGLFAAGASGVAPLVAGAVGGASVEAFKRIRAENRGYKEFTKKLAEEFEDLVNGQFGTENVATLVKRYQELEAQRGQETNKGSKEVLYDQMRYLGVYMKRREKGKEVDGKALLDAYFESEGTEIANNQTEADQLLEAIKEIKLVDRRKLAWAVGRGAVFGAVGGVVGAAVADWFAHSEINPFRAAATAGREVASAGKEAAEATVSQPSVPATSVHETIQETILPKESVTVPQGSDSLKFTDDAITQELTKRLGRVPTNKELVSALSRVIADSKIENATGIPAGTQLDLTGLKDVADIAKGLKPDISPSIAARPEMIPLPKGSNGWEIAERMVKEAGGKGTFDEIKAVDYAISKASGVAVPSWDLPGQIDHRFLPAGFEFHENTDVKVLLTQIQDGNFQPEGAAVAADVGAPRVIRAPIPIRPEVSVPQEAAVTPAAEVIPSPPAETPPQIPPKPPAPSPAEIKPPDVVGGLDTSIYTFTDPSSRIEEIYIGPNLKTTLLEQVTNDLKVLYPGAPPEVTNRLANQLAYSSNLALNPTDQLPTGAKIARDKVYKNLLLSFLPKDTSFMTHTGTETLFFDKNSPTSLWREAAKMAGRALGRIANEEEIMLVAKALQQSSNPAAEINERFFGPLRVDDKVRQALKIVTGKIAIRVAA